MTYEINLGNACVVFIDFLLCLQCSNFCQPPWGGGLLPWGGGLLPWGGMMRRITLNMSDFESLQRLSRCMLIFAPCEALCSIALCGHVTARKL